MPAFAVIGGGVDGAYYVRQLLRAVRAGRLATERIVVVDRDPACAAKALADERVTISAVEWNDWLDRNLEALPAGSQLVPYHWAPHLLVEWLSRRLRQAGREVASAGPVPPVGTPFEHQTSSGNTALSYATWTCPLTCVEPALCPHTGGAKDWSLAADLESVPAGFDGAIVFPCLHLIWGVGTIPVDLIKETARRVASGTGARRYRVATSSHCHALAATLTVA